MDAIILIIRVKKNVPVARIVSVIWIGRRMVWDINPRPHVHAIAIRAMPRHHTGVHRDIMVPAQMAHPVVRNVRIPAPVMPGRGP